MEKSKSNWKIKEVIKSFLGREITTYKIITRWFEHENSRNPVRFTKEMASTGSKETASLIASAPEMLKVLKEYVKYEATHDVAFYQEMKAAVKNKEYKKSLQVLFMAIDVINKAEGK